MGKRHGTRIAIGGREDRDGDKLILAEVARCVGSGRLVVATIASQEPDVQYPHYKRAFRDLGLRDIVRLDVRNRECASSEEAHQALRGATGIFFTGGDQLRITTRIGGTHVSDAVLEILRSGGVVAGTSAGASAMSETMVASGEGCSSFRAGETVAMSPGLGLIRGVIIDQHFAERGRMGRLLGAVAHNPGNIGLGIDEDTAVVVQGAGPLRVVGSGAVYVLDCADTTHTNLDEECGGLRVMSLFDVRLHVLSHGDAYDLEERIPIKASARDQEAQRGRGEGKPEGGRA